MLLWWGTIASPRARQPAPIETDGGAGARPGRKPAKRAPANGRAPASRQRRPAPPAAVRRARTLLKFGDTGGAAEACRSLLLSSDGRIGPLERAAARLTFGEIFEQSGDYMSACEQWLIARELYEQHGDRATARQIWQRMRACNAPTDWVLSSY